jgi:hypothetical protein
MGTCGITHCPRPAHRSECGPKTECQRGSEGDEREESRGPGNSRGDGARHNGGNWRVDRVHEAKPAPDEAAGQKKAEYAGGQGNKKLQHIEFPELGSTCRHITERPGERFSSSLLPTCREVVCESQAITERFLALGSSQGRS